MYIELIQKTTSDIIDFVDELKIEFETQELNDNTFKRPVEILAKIQDLADNCSVKFSDKDKCPAIDSVLNEIKQKFVQLQIYINPINKVLKNEIENSWKASINSFNSVFNNKYNLPIPRNIDNDVHCPIQLFRNMKYAELSSPILNIEKDNIVCFPNSLHCSIGPIIPSLYSKSIKINFISFVDHPLSLYIDTEEKYKDLFSSKDTFQKGEMVQISFSLQSLLPQKVEEFTIHSVLHFSSPHLNELDLPCEFLVKVAPLSILISCTQHPLSYKDGIFYLCTDKIISLSKISFSIQNYYLLDNSNLVYQISSLDDNTVPDLNHHFNIKEKTLQLEIPSIDKVKRLHGEVKLKFSDNFSTSIIIDAAVIPFDFQFDIYDPSTRVYVSNMETMTVYYSSDYFDRDTILHCRVYSPSFVNLFQGFIDTDLPKEIKYNFKGINKSFTISQNQKFDITLKIERSFNLDYTSYYRLNGNLSNKKYFISIVINGIKRTIYLEFREPEKPNYMCNIDIFNQEYLSKFNTYLYNSESKIWDRILNPSELKYYNNNNALIVSPFSYLFTSKETIYYDDYYCKIENANRNDFLQVNSKGETRIDMTTTSRTYSKSGKFKQVLYSFLRIKEDSSTYYPIYGISNGIWYPVFMTYPQLQWTLLEITDENISTALELLKQMNINMPSNINCTNFYILCSLLQNSKVIKNIENLIMPLPKTIKSNFDPIVAASKYFDEKDNKMIILSYNAIVQFYFEFYSRFIEIQNNLNKLTPFPISCKDIELKVLDCYNEYCKVNPQITNTDNMSSTTKLIKKIEDDLKNIDVLPKPPIEEQHEAFLFIENSNPIPKSKLDLPNYITPSHPQANSNSNQSSFPIKLPPINIPSKSELPVLTIPALDKIYLSCIQGTRLLPLFVHNMKVLKDSLMEQEAIEYFGRLLQIYKDLPINDFSFISTSTNSFNKAFASMIGKLKNNGVNFQELLPSKCIISDELIQDFIQIPEKDKIYLPPQSWTTNEKSLLADFSASSFLSYGKFNLYKGNNVKIENPLDISVENEKPEEKLISTQEIEVSNEQNVQFSQYIFDIEQKLNSEQDDDDSIFESPQNAENTDKKENKAYVLSGNHTTHTKQINNINLDGKTSLFTEKSGIQRAVSRMKEMDKNEILKISNAKVHPFNHNYLKPDVENYPIISLIQQGSEMAHKFIKTASDIEIPLSNIAVNILVDCSIYISNENKVFNMTIICALTQALTALEIPYSAAVIGDQNFKCVIKPFSDPHSHKCLQRICDCLLIKRYRTKLAFSTKFAIDSMAYTADSSKPYRAIFTFSDGLDEQLVQTKAWSEIISDSKLSFGYIFIKSSFLKDENLRFVENVWSTFENDIRKNTKSNIKVAPIIAEMNEDIEDKLLTLFANVMERSEIIENEKSDKKYESPTFEINNELSNIDIFLNYLKADYTILKEIFIETTQVLRQANTFIDKLNPLDYKNCLRKIASCSLDSIPKDTFYAFMKQYLINRVSIDYPSLETIFKPNKASQTVLSTTGTDFDITALVLNLINPVPDPMIYLEEKGGFIRNYGISIVIDASYSCFNEISGPHSFQTIREILSSLSFIDLPCFDLIIATNKNPIVICSEVGTYHALHYKSSLWGSLFSVLQNPVIHTDLGSAIHAAFDLRRMRSTEYTNLLFVLTDGLYQQSERGNIIDNVNNCMQSGITTFGIGIGIYPKGIEKIFPQVIFSTNPSNLMKSIASIYGDNVHISDMMNSIINPTETENDLLTDIRKIIENEKTPSFASLKKELHDIPPAIDAFDDMYNVEKDIGNKKDGFYNPTGPRTSAYIKGLLNTQQILIVMLWDNTLSESESEYVSPQYITHPSKKGSECIKTAVDYFGISLKTVQNYEAAINELTKQSRKGFCDYYAVWVFCGPQHEILPDRQSDPNLVGQFNEVLIQFWQNGGSIVFWAEGDPLFYQVNLFLQTVTFYNELDCPSGKTKLRIQGEHAGNDTLLPDDSNTLSNIKTFNRSPQYFKECQRTTLSHNIGKIFEGITISFAPYNLEDIKPFKPFARDSEGGISSLFYTANLTTGTGDIVIDCGYTKCFTQMESDGTFRYIQNIAGWTARPEIHKHIDSIEPCDWRPKAVTYKIQKGVKWNDFKPMGKKIIPIDPHKLNALWAIDSSGSVRSSDFYHSELSKIITEYYKKGDDIYIWDSEYKHLTYEQLLDFNNKKEGHGGTESSLIAEVAKISTVKDHLIIVTDGDVNSGAIDRSDEIMKANKIEFKFVTTFIIGTGSLSVGAPYSRGCQNVTYSIKKPGSRQVEATLSANDIEALKNIGMINNYSQFLQQYNNLDSAIQAIMLGKKDDPAVKQNLISLKDRIIKSGIDKTQLNDFNQKYQSLMNMADGALRDKYTLEDIAAAKKKKKK